MRLQVASNRHGLCRHATATRTHASAAPTAIAEDTPPPQPPLQPRNILVLGGTGRVGSAIAASLLQRTPGHTITLAGRNPDGYANLVEKRPELSGAAWAPVDVYSHDAVKAAAAGKDLVVHAAGPFQRRRDTTALAACIAAGTRYMDVCDDMVRHPLSKLVPAGGSAAVGDQLLVFGSLLSAA